MREIPLTKGYVALVDDEDYERIACHKWCAQEGPWGTRAVRHAGRVRVYMHREVLGVVFGDARHVDHINHDMLDNRKDNLRLVDHSMNQCNRKKTVGSSRYLGVSLNRGKWDANASGEYIGRFTSEEAAARAYDDAARRIQGPFASLNFPGPGELSAHEST